MLRGFVLIMLCLFITFGAEANAEIKPLQEKDVALFLENLNSQGKKVTYDDTATNDKLWGYDNEYGSFRVGEMDGDARFLYKADINNDGIEEYIVCSQGGSGAFFDVDNIYKNENGKFTDIFGDIKIPMRRLMRDAEKEDYDLEDGYVGYMNGSLIIEEDGGKMYFTIRQVSRDYGIDDFEKSFQDPRSWKFLWDKGGIKLISYYVGDKRVYPTN